MPSWHCVCCMCPLIQLEVFLVLLVRCYLLLYLDHVDQSYQARPCMCKHTVSADTYPPRGGAMPLLLGYGGTLISPHIVLMSAATNDRLRKAQFFLGCVWCCPKGYALRGHSLPGPLAKEARLFILLCLFAHGFCLYLLFFPACEIPQCPGWDTEEAEKNPKICQVIP